MNICDTLIATGIQEECELTPKGAEEAIIINYADVDFDKSIVNNDGTIESIVLKSTKKGYKVAQGGQTPFTGTNTAMEAGNIKNTFTHQVGIVVLANTPASASGIVDKMANGLFVLVLKNKQKSNDDETLNGKYQVYGWDNGLRASEITQDKYSDDTFGGWSITLQEQNANHSALFLSVGTSAGTDAAYESLTSTAQ